MQARRCRHHLTSVVATRMGRKKKARQIAPKASLTGTAADSNAEERALLQAAYAGVTPLPATPQRMPAPRPPRGRTAHPGQSAASSSAPPGTVEIAAPGRWRKAVSPTPRFHVDGAECGDIQLRRHDADRRQLRRLKRGSAPPSATLDLHGHTRDEATRALTAFVERQRAHGHQVVLVITGRGQHSEDGLGVLRRHVIDLLTSRLAHAVLYAATAPVHWGGSGALLLRLTRHG
ncbi:MAG: Smr/MutS family protein [Polyangiales bacterium]